MREDDSKRLVKNSLYDFYQDYKTYKDCKNRPDEYETDTMIRRYIERYQNILSQIRGTLPNELTNDLQNLVNSLRGILATYPSIDENHWDLLGTGECPGKALEMFNNFDNYFK